MLINSCFGVNVISGGDPLEIYTEKDGEVIFKKYSPMGELSSFAEQICESIHKAGDTELKLATTVSGFLGKQMEA